MPHSPHAQQLQVNASCSSDGSLILLAISAAAHSEGMPAYTACMTASVTLTFTQDTCAHERHDEWIAVRALVGLSNEAHERLGFRRLHLDMSAALERAPSGMWMLVGLMSLM